MPVINAKKNNFVEALGISRSSPAGIHALNPRGNDLGNDLCLLVV